MATRHHPITSPAGLRRVGLDPTPDRFALHLDCGIWRASCTGCGFELAEGHRQDRVERKAALATCPICVSSRNGPSRSQSYLLGIHLHRGVQPHGSTHLQAEN
jgi:hypothetical protein